MAVWLFDGVQPTRNGEMRTIPAALLGPSMLCVHASLESTE